MNNFNDNRNEATANDIFYAGIFIAVSIIFVAVMVGLAIGVFPGNVLFAVFTTIFAISNALFVIYVLEKMRTFGYSEE